MQILPNDKPQARAEASARRATLHAAAAATASQGLLAQPFPAQRSPAFATISGFYPYGSEIDTRPLLAKLAGEGWISCLPLIIAKFQPLRFRAWPPGAPTTLGPMKIPVPLATAPDVEPDVLLVPLLAFDRAGYRLGYGGGFYDATLAALRAKKKILAIGVAYAGQEVQSVPHEAHDARLDYVMTEKELLKCA